MALNNKFGILGFCSVLLVAVVVAQSDSSGGGGGGGGTGDSGGGSGGFGGRGGAGGGGGLLGGGGGLLGGGGGLLGGGGGVPGGGGGIPGGPKDLLKNGLNFAVSHIQEQVLKAPVFVQAANDPATAQAHSVCMGVLERSMNDLKRSFDRLTIFDFDLDDLDDRLFDLKVWLSSASKGQNTCTDAFEKAQGPTADKMKDLLSKSKELTLVGFNLIDKLSAVLQGLQGPKGAGGQGPQGVSPRKLLQVNMPPEQVPAWTKPNWKNIIEGDGAAAKAKAHAVVGADGKFKTIMEAVKTIPTENPDLYIIYVKAGVYNENVVISNNQPNVVLIGDGPAATKVTGNRSDKKGFNTMQSATLGVDGFNVLVKDMAFENTAPPDEGPAVALRIAADHAVVVNCRMDSNQDTLFAQVYRQFYRDCVVSGTIDFVFGGGVAVFKNLHVIVRKPDAGQSNMIVAQNREFPNDISGIVLDGAKITADPGLAADKATQSFLGRPWKPYSRMIIMNSEIEGFINPLGWEQWQANQPNTQNSFIGELGNQGPGADLSKRVTWPSYKKLAPGDAAQFCPQTFLKGDAWIPPSGVAY